MKTDKFQAFIRQFIKLILLVCSVSLAVSAQSSIFNTPSTDIQPEKTLYLEADYFAHFDSFREGGFHEFGSTIVYGARKNLEVGVNLLYGRSEEGDALELQPNVKWKFYENNDSETAASVGAIAFVPLNKTAGSQPSAMLYANVSKAFKSVKGMRLTGGVYTTAGTERDFGAKSGFTAGIEQPVTSKIIILADWTSGNNRFGYANVGAIYQINEKQFFGAGYSFGNSGRGNNYFTTVYGFTF